MAKILNVFYGADNLPYKDKERTVHFPIVGNAFQGASDTTEIRFYFDRIGEPNTSWVAVSKLPNGKIGSKVLQVEEDTTLEEEYALLKLSSFYTQYKGDLFISLQGYNGEVQVEYDESSELYTIKGTPTIQATGSIKLAINYATQFVGSGEESNADLQSMLSLLGTKLNIGSGIVVLTDLANTDLSSYSNGQLIYDKTTDAYYIKTNSSPYYQLANNNGLLGNKGALIRFFGLTDSITLQEIYDLIGANRYASLNVDGIEYLVIMSVNNSIKAYDLLEKKLYDYTDAPQDTFADVLNEPATTFVEHISIANRIYGTDANARETTIPYSVNVVKNGIVQRGSDGQINVPTNPAYAYNAASKNYVDSNYGKKVQLTIDNDTFVLTVKLLNNNDVVISQANVDLPLESIVVSAQYYDTYTYDGVTYTKVLVIVLATTDNPIIAPVGDLVSGLVSETTFNNAVAQLQTNINKCVQQTNTANVVYGTNNVGTQTTIRYGTSVSANGLVQRDALGQINVSATPSSNSNATSKQYVDTFGRTLEFSIDNSTYVMTFKLKDNNGNVISTQTIDLPLETMVVDGSYDNTTESLVLELKNGQTISIPISDLISGLVSETSLATTLQSYYTKAQIDQMVAGFVFADVDDYLSDSSTNPVENRVITDALEAKANVDGNYQTMTVGLANNLDTKVVQNDQDAYNFRTAGGSLEIGDTCKVKSIVGGSLGFNQLILDGDFATLGNWYTTSEASRSVSNNTMTITVNSDFGTDKIKAFLIQDNLNINKLHKHFVSFEITANTATNSCRIRQPFLTNWFNVGTTKQVISYIDIGSSSNQDNTFQVQGVAILAGTVFTIKNVMCIDLTAMFGSTIADYIYSLEQATAGAGVAWFKRYFPNTYYAYNAGTLVNVSTSGKKYVGFNQWDEQWENGYLNDTTGAEIVANSTLRSKNYIPVLPNTTYTFDKTNSPSTYTWKAVCFSTNAINNVVGVYSGSFYGSNTFTTPSNCQYIRFYIASNNLASYSNDICLHFHYDGERDGEYEPYESNEYALSPVELRGIAKKDAQGNLYFDGDSYTPDGKVVRKYGIVDLGTLTWERAQWSGANYHFNSQGIIGLVNTSRVNISCARFVAVGRTHVIEVGNVDNVITIRTSSSTLSGLIEIRCDTYETAVAFKQAMSGVYLVYELATETEETTDTYQETQQVDNWGTEQYLPPESDTRPCEVPVGHDTDYLLDLKSKLEIMPDSPSADGDYVVHSESSVNTYVALGAWLSSNGWIKLTDISGYDAEKTQTLKNVNGTLTWVDD